MSLLANILSNGFIVAMLSHALVGISLVWDKALLNTGLSYVFVTLGTTGGRIFDVGSSELAAPNLRELRTGAFDVQIVVYEKPVYCRRGIVSGSLCLPREPGHRGQAFQVCATS